MKQKILLWTLAFLFLINFVNAVSIPIDNSTLRAYYSFDDNTTNDLTKKFNATAINNLGYSASCVIGSCADLSTGYINYGNISGVVDDETFTIVGWFYADTNTNNGCFFSLYNGIGYDNMIIYRKTTTNGLTFWNNAGAVDGTLDYFTPGRWQFFAIVGNGTSKFKVYNGSNMEILTAGGVPDFKDSDPSMFGAYNGGSSGKWDGRFDELALFSVPLNDSQIDLLFNNGTGYNPLAPAPPAPSAPVLTVNTAFISPSTENASMAVNLSLVWSNYNITASNVVLNYNNTFYEPVLLTAIYNLNGSANYTINVTAPFIYFEGENVPLYFGYNITNFTENKPFNTSTEYQVINFGFPRINITASNILNSASIGNLSGTINTDSYSTTSLNYLYRVLTTGFYELYVQAPGYAINNISNRETIQINSTTPVIYNRNFELYTNNSILFNIYNLTGNGSLLQNTTSITLNGETITYNFETENGTLYIDNLNDDTYRTIISHIGFDDTILYLTVAYSAHLDADIYLESGTVSRTFITQNTFGVSVPNATITFYRNINGTYITAAQEITDFSGRATVNLQEDVIYRMVAIASGYDTFTGNVQPTETEYTITLTETSITPFTTIYQNIAWTTAYSELATELYTTYIISDSTGSLANFGSSTTYNGINYYTNTTGSPGGGQINFNVTPIVYNNQTFITFFYWFQISGESVIYWNETYLLNQYNITNISIEGGLFDDITNLPGTSPIRGLFGAFIILCLIITFGAASRNITVGLVGGLSGLALNWYLNLMPRPLIVVSIIVIVILIIADNMAGGR